MKYILIITILLSACSEEAKEAAKSMCKNVCELHNGTINNNPTIFADINCVCKDGSVFRVLDAGSYVEPICGH